MLFKYHLSRNVLHCRAIICRHSLAANLRQPVRMNFVARTMSQLKVAMCQVSVGKDKATNIKTVSSAIEAVTDADMVVSI